MADSEAALNMPPEIQKGLTNVVAETGMLFGTRHYRDYHFLLALSDHVAHFGLEHHESNDSRLPERAFLEPGGAFMVGSLLPHEFVHSWNGKFRRPADLTTPEYETPMQTDLLWVYEGLTDYLGPMLAARSGLWTPEQYHSYLAEHRGEPGAGPARDAPGVRCLDTAVGEPGMRPPRGWMDWVRGTDYYDEGDLLWLEVNTIINRVTNGQKIDRRFLPCVPRRAERRPPGEDLHVRPACGRAQQRGSIRLGGFLPRAIEFAFTGVAHGRD